MDFAKQARITDPRQIARLSPKILAFSAIPPPSSIHDQIVSNWGVGAFWGQYSGPVRQFPTFCGCGKPWLLGCPVCTLMHAAH